MKISTLFGFMGLAFIASTQLLGQTLEIEISKELAKQFVSPQARCDTIGKFGRTLSVLSAESKGKVCAACGKYLQQKHPRAFKAVCPK